MKILLLGKNGQVGWELQRALAPLGEVVALKAGPDQVAAIVTEGYPTPAPLPRNSRLDTSKLEKTFELQLPEWQAGVARMLTEIAG